MPELFEQEILSHTKPSDGEKAEAHQLFQLTAANNGKLPISMYVELNLDFLGIVVPKVGICITQEPTELLHTHHKTKLPGVVGWNLIKLVYEVFIQNMVANVWQMRGVRFKSHWGDSLFCQWSV